MDLTIPDSVSTMDRVKIEAGMLIPLARILREQIGQERTREILATAIAEARREQVGRRADALPGSPLEKFQAVMARSAQDNGPQLDIEMHEMRPDAMRFDVTGCRYAELFTALGESEIGALLLCNTDDYVAEVGGDAVEFTRSQTIMQGASHCDFCYRIRSGGSKPSNP